MKDEDKKDDEGIRTLVEKSFNLLLSLIIWSFPIYIVGHSFYRGFRTLYECKIGCSVHRVALYPWLFHGREITIFGFMNLEFEGHQIFFSEEMADYGVEGIWLSDIPDEILDNRDYYNYRHVRITGRYNAQSHGHGDLSIGTIENIKEIDIVRPRKRYPVTGEDR